MSKKLDPQLAELLQAADDAGIPAIHTFPYVSAREFYVLTSKKLAGSPPDDLDVADKRVKTPDDFLFSNYLSKFFDY